MSEETASSFPKRDPIIALSNPFTHGVVQNVPKYVRIAGEAMVESFFKEREATRKRTEATDKFIEAFEEFQKEKTTPSSSPFSSRTKPTHIKKRKQPASSQIDSRDADEPETKASRHTDQQSSPHFEQSVDARDPYAYSRTVSASPQDIELRLCDLYTELKWAKDDIHELAGLHKKIRVSTVERSTKLFRRGLDMLVSVLNKTDKFMLESVQYSSNSSVGGANNGRYAISFNSRPQHITFPPLVENIRREVFNTAFMDNQHVNLFQLRNENQHTHIVHVTLEPTTTTSGRKRFHAILAGDSISIGERMLLFLNAAQAYLSSVAEYSGFIFS